jgi:hypothetical protein
MTRFSRALALGICTGLFLAVGFATGTPANASCMPTPRVSDYRFTGTVTQVGDDGRTAAVRTDDGRTVTVHGSPADGPNVRTSVDRTYQVGVRYEFHPLNATSPYQDNACTATHPIEPAATGGQLQPSAGAIGVARPDASSSSGWGLPWWAATGLMAVLAAAVGIWLARRRLRPAA